MFEKGNMKPPGAKRAQHRERPKWGESRWQQAADQASSERADRTARAEAARNQRPPRPSDPEYREYFTPYSEPWSPQRMAKYRVLGKHGAEIGWLAFNIQRWGLSLDLMVPVPAPRVTREPS